MRQRAPGRPSSRGHFDAGASLLFLVYTYVWGGRQGSARFPRFHVQTKEREASLPPHPSGRRGDCNGWRGGDHRSAKLELKFGMTWRNCLLISARVTLPLKNSRR